MEKNKKKPRGGRKTPRKQVVIRLGKKGKIPEKLIRQAIIDVKNAAKEVLPG